MIAGFGVNYSDYKVYSRVEGEASWICPMYSCWRDMITRCYNSKELARYPTYKGCTVSDEWRSFSNFRAWMESQDWEGNKIDKDILFEGNKIYSAETCVFVDNATNLLLTDRSRFRGKYPLGVSILKYNGRFEARCRVNGVSTYIDHYKTPEEAHKSYLKFKSNVVEMCANRQSEERVKIALLKRAKDMREKSK